MLNERKPQRRSVNLAAARLIYERERVFVGTYPVANRKESNHCSKKPLSQNRTRAKFHITVPCNHLFHVPSYTIPVTGEPRHSLTPSLASTCSSEVIFTLGYCCRASTLTGSLGVFTKSYFLRLCLTIQLACILSQQPKFFKQKIGFNAACPNPPLPHRQCP